MELEKETPLQCTGVFLWEFCGFIFSWFADGLKMRDIYQKKGLNAITFSGVSRNYGKTPKKSK
jgi:hypothetical protein